MKQIIKQMAVMVTLLLLPILAAGSPAYAACGTSSSSKSQVLNGIGVTGGNCDTSGVGNTVAAVTSILSYVVGAVAIIMIIVGGFRYITSGGDSGKVGSAKNTLIYAIIGLVIVALAQLIVNLVLTKANSVNTCPSGQHLDSSGNCVSMANGRTSPLAIAYDRVV